MTKQSMKDYWQNNIENYGKFYNQTSDENIVAPSILKMVYKKTIFPLERKVTLERYRKTMDYIEANVKQDMVVVDLGCGTGIYTTELLLRGAKVIAVDFVESALLATEKKVKEMVPEMTDSVEYLLLDIMEKDLPESDIVFAIGITPYIDSIEIFFKHILPTTQKVYCLFLNKLHWANRIRNYLEILNVRNYRFVDEKHIIDIITKHGFKGVEKKLCGTSYMYTFVIN